MEARVKFLYTKVSLPLFEGLQRNLFDAEEPCNPGHSYISSAEARVFDVCDMFLDDVCLAFRLQRLQRSRSLTFVLCFLTTFALQVWTQGLWIQGL